MTRSFPTTRLVLTTAAVTAAALAAALVPAAPLAAAAPPAPPAAGTPAPPAAGPGPSSGSCPSGAFCLWDRHGFGGIRTAHELSGTDIESCIPLPAGASAGSLANRTGRPVTTYQSAECGETGEFDTYPGGGTWVPDSPYRVRAFKIWEN
ncbi:peptidase inhibitor family I36 protein [Streptomyces sp. WAC 00631]|uniref:peptidase inhibitor family I36 protein n=1 Tax=Streptomyces sp. WAC 00631 TaxID=2203201 RepID=UPI000F7BA63F|nr:peptidase inhibitor family I36 protein [Streptomyces sp. WAC 00631]MCC5034844.1 peptidase inhibitor family I36 protein [Streptomyces sp. WAC 00631]